ncbi:hypothetical protein AC579_3197 [Pseudocercospora musae]|uniref:Uncharacterized protein n=1 Tax=Pseudocercospora musae TaxID=113226 RepID=A0A139IS66_9PEZI|nr:hypothetical protein AC579_3197 [Pseudocercospora musae]
MRNASKELVHVEVVVESLFFAFARSRVHILALVITSFVTDGAECFAVGSLSMQAVAFGPFRRRVIAYRLNRGRLHDSASSKRALSIDARRIVR